MLINLKKNFICGYISNHSNMPIADLNSKHLTPLLEKLNREDKFCFLIGDFNINLMKINSESENLQFYNTMCSNFSTQLVLEPTSRQSKTLIDKSSLLYLVILLIQYLTA